MDKMHKWCINEKTRQRMDGWIDRHIERRKEGSIFIQNQNALIDFKKKETYMDK